MSFASHFLLFLLLTLPVPKDTISLVAGGQFASDGAAKLAPLKSPFGLVESPSGTIVFVEMTGHRVREIDSQGSLKTIAGSGIEGKSGDGGPAAKAELNGPHALAVHADGNLFIADTWNHRVRKIDTKTHQITTIIGTGEKGFSGDGGPALKATFGGIYSISLTPDGKTMVLADLDNRRVRSVNLLNGTVTTIAGNGTKGVPVDGANAVSSPLVDPRAVATDGEGNVYILERGGHALRVVDKEGKIRTLVGDGKAGDSGDDGPGIAARLNGPKDLTIDRDGSVLIADTENHTIRRFNPKGGKITRVAGSGKKGTGGLNGSPKEADLNQPHGVTVAKDGSILISDSSNHRILRLERAK